MKISSSFDPPRIWWCATGPLAFLPIHAAGLYNTMEAGFKISDFVTSSYTPTLTALLEPPFIAHRDFQGLLGVSQPCTPGLSQLPNAKKELTQIKRIGSSFHVWLATLSKVFLNLPRAHFVFSTVAGHCQRSSRNMFLMPTLHSSPHFKLPQAMKTCQRKLSIWRQGC